MQIKLEQVYKYGKNPLVVKGQAKISRGLLKQEGPEGPGTLT